MYSTVPEHVVSALVSAHPSTRSELHCIRDRRDPSRYQGVYPHVHGSRYTVNGYRARVLKFFELGSGFASAEDAARAIVAFYKHHYGAEWCRAFDRRKVTPWRVRARRVGSRVAFGVEIYVRGQPQTLTGPDGAPLVWSSRAAAKSAARAEMKLRFDRIAETLTVPHQGLIFWRG